MLCVDNIHILFGFLLQNGFSINTDLTKLMFKSQVQIKNLISNFKENRSFLGLESHRNIPDYSNQQFLLNFASSPV